MTRKTAISIDENLFKKAERLAREMRVSRSRLIAQAVEEFLRRHENLRLLQRINGAYETEPDSEERRLLHQAKRAMREVTGRDGY